MKLKVRIAGPKVYDIAHVLPDEHCYRFGGVRDFHARNRRSGKAQEVVALADGDEDAIADFKKHVATQKPESSEASTISFKDYGGWMSGLVKERLGLP